MPPNRQITSSHNRQTTPDNSTFESVTHIQAPPLNVDGDEDDAYILPPTLNAVDESDEENVTARIPKRRGRKVDPTFLLPPHSELLHPYIDWVLDKSAMEQYMHDYAKQEGFAVNALKERGGVIRWCCSHSGKYNDHRNLPADVTDKPHNSYHFT